MIVFEIKVENKDYGQYLIGLIVFSKFAFIYLFLPQVPLNLTMESSFHYFGVWMLLTCAISYRFTIGSWFH